MKKLKLLLLALVICVCLPSSVSAAQKINVYIFKGEGCGYCAKALAFFESLDDEYKSYFNLVEKEVWHDKENANLMQRVANELGIEVNGVPLIVIGNRNFSGYHSSYDEEIKAAIKEAYENKDGSYNDLVGHLIGGEDTEKNSNSAAITIIVLFVAVAGVAFLIYMAKSDSTAIIEVEEKEEIIRPELKVKNEEVSSVSEVKKEAPKKKSTSSTKSTSNKTTVKKANASKNNSTVKKSTTTAKKSVATQNKKTTTSNAKKKSTTSKSTTKSPNKK